MPEENRPQNDRRPQIVLTPPDRRSTAGVSTDDGQIPDVHPLIARQGYVVLASSSDGATAEGVSKAQGRGREQGPQGARRAPGPEPGRREYDCVFVQPGRVKRADGELSNWLIPADVLQAAATQFDSISCYVDHPEQFGLWGDRQAPQVKNLAGVTFDARWSEAQQALVGKIRLYDQDPNSPGAFMGALLDQILADQAAGKEVPPIGLSAVFYQRSELDERTGLRVTSEIVHAESVDFVYSAGARGYVRAALASLRGASPAPSSHLSQGAPAPLVPAVLQAPSEGGTHMPEETLLTPQDAPEDQGSPLGFTPRGQDAPAQVADQAPPPDPQIATLQHEVSELRSAIAHLSGLLASQEERHTIQDMGNPPRSRIHVGPGSLEQVELAFQALMDGVRPPDGIRPLTGIRELYHLLSGDYEMTGLFQPDRVYLANVTVTTMANITANILNKVLINEYVQYPRFWEPAVTTVDFSSLQDAAWISLGGVGELPTVAEGAAYTELTWDDFKETDAFVKKGGYLGITIEAIDKDDTRRLRAAPRALAQAAWLTLGKSVAAIFTDASGTGPTMSDSNVLFDSSNHGNLGTTALSQSAWRTTKIAMMKQTEINSSERLGALTAPYFCWVPVDLEDTAVIALATDRAVGSANNDVNVDAEGEGREERLRNARRRVITVPFWTDTNNWAAQADPRLYPSIGLGFRYGRTPEIFSVADPRAGLMFSNDVMPVKVRFFYAVGPTDWRGLYKHNVS